MRSEPATFVTSSSFRFIAALNQSSSMHHRGLIPHVSLENASGDACVVSNGCM